MTTTYRQRGCHVLRKKRKGMQKRLMYSRICKKVNNSFTLYGLVGSQASNYQYTVLVAFLIIDVRSEGRAIKALILCETSRVWLWYREKIERRTSNIERSTLMFDVHF